MEPVIRRIKERVETGTREIGETAEKRSKGEGA